MDASFGFGGLAVSGGGGECAVVASVVFPDERPVLARSVFPLLRQQPRQPAGAAGLSSGDRSQFDTYRAEVVVGDRLRAVDGADCGLRGMAVDVRAYRHESPTANRADKSNDAEVGSPYAIAPPALAGPVVCPVELVVRGDDAHINQRGGDAYVLGGPAGVVFAYIRAGFRAGRSSPFVGWRGFSRI